MERAVITKYFLIHALLLTAFTLTGLFYSESSEAQSRAKFLPKKKKAKKKKLERNPAQLSPIAPLGPSERLPAPRKLNVGRAYNYDFPRVVTWEKTEDARQYRIEVFEYPSEELIFVTKTWSTFTEVYDGSVDYRPKKKKQKGPQYYFARVAAMDRNGNVGQFSPCIRIHTGYEPPNAIPPNASNVGVCSKRLPASFSLPYLLLGKNRNYDKTMVQLEGASFVVSTGDLIDAGGDFATAMLTSLRGTWWFTENLGFEASFKSKLTDYNQLATEISPTQIEGRTHLRFKIPFPMLSWIRQFQVSLFGGYEHYSNGAASNSTFATAYTITKAGMTLRFPLFRSFDTGGEVAYGIGAGNGQKLEAQGHLNYYISERASMGVGYRIHLFKTQDTSIGTSLTGTFKEAYAEAFGSLKFSF